MVFRAFGREGLVNRIREQCRFAALFASWIEENSQFEALRSGDNGSRVLPRAGRIRNVSGPIKWS